jgi:hypothetical protein
LPILSLLGPVAAFAQPPAGGRLPWPRFRQSFEHLRDLPVGSISEDPIPSGVARPKP